MGKRLLKLPRRLFGYQASSVDQLIADRDSMLGVADQRVRSAEARIAELEEELSRRDEDIEAVKARLGPSEDPAPAGPASIERAQDSDEADLVPAALDDNEADEVEEWPVPIIRPRTVEFTPPPEPSADFDPMPIGGEDNEWSSPAGASAWAPEDEGTTDEPAAHADPWPSVDQAQGESWAALEDMVPAYEAPAEPAFEEHAEPAYEEHADAEDIPELPEHEAEPLAEPSPDPVVPQMTPAYMSEELAHVVKAAEESATSLPALLERWDTLPDETDHVEFYWWPHTEDCQLKRNTRVPLADLAPLPRWKAVLDDELLANALFAAVCRAGVRMPALVPPANRLATRLLGARTYTDRSWKVFAHRRRVRFRETEWAFPRALLPDVLRELDATIRRRGWRISFPVEVRVAAGDDRWLSTAYGRETAYLAAHRYVREPWADYLGAVGEIVRAVAGADARPHWGKLHPLAAADLAPRYPRFTDAVALRARLDPDGRFANAYLDRVLGAVSF